MPDPYEEIRQRVSCKDAARQYGLEVNRSGFALCPWHSDRHPSLKLYDGDRGCYCFACQCGGDVIGLVGQLLGLDRRAAARQITLDFGLGLSLDRPPTRAEQAEVQKRRQVADTFRDFQAWKDDMVRSLSDTYYLGWSALRDLPESLWLDCEAEAIRLLPVLDQWLDCLGGDITDQMQVFRDRTGVIDTCMRILNAMPPRFRQD